MDATHSESDGGGRGGIWWWGSLAALSAVVFVYIMAVSMPRRQPPGTEGPAIGRRLPYLQLEPLTGAARPLSLGDLQGHVTLVNYWGTWCVPCRREFPHLVNLAARFAQDASFTMVAVSCGQGNDEDLDSLRSETETYLQSANVVLPTYADQNAASRRAMSLALGFDQFAYPTTLVFDQQGVIRGLWIGYSPQAPDEMGAVIDDLLQHPAG